VNMVEASADEVSEEDMLEAIMFGHEEIKRLVAFQEEIVAKVGKEKMDIVLREVDPELEKAVIDFLGDDLKKAVLVTEKLDRNQQIEEVQEKVIRHFAEIDEERIDE